MKENEKTIKEVDKFLDRIDEIMLELRMKIEGY